MACPYVRAEDAYIRRCAGRVPAAVIAKKLGRSRGGIVKRAGVLGVSLRVYGELHSQARYTDKRVARVRREYARYRGPDVHAEIRRIAERHALPVRYVRRVCYGDIRPPEGGA